MPPPTAGFLTERLEALLYMEAVTQQFFPLLLLECFNGSEILFCILNSSNFNCNSSFGVVKVWEVFVLLLLLLLLPSAQNQSSFFVICFAFFLFRLKVFLVSIVCKVVVGGDGGSESCYLNFDLVSRHLIPRIVSFFIFCCCFSDCLAEWIFPPSLIFASTTDHHSSLVRLRRREGKEEVSL